MFATLLFAGVQKILEIEFDSIAEDLKREHERRGMKASGNWVNSLVRDVQQTGIGIISAKIIAPAYTKWLVQGRKPGKFPPISAIERWIQDKNKFNQVVNQIGLQSLAFLIARKIKEKGTKYHQQGGTDLIKSVVTPERINIILSKVIEEVKFVLVGEVKSQYETI